MLTNKTGITQEDYADIQKCLLGVLKAIHDVCEKHRLRYYVIAGTMLGAIRHKGFIPWDDDADVAMPRKDYEIFMEHANEWLPEQYELVNTTLNSKYPYLFGRVQDRRTTYILRRAFGFVGGIPVDVFPLDGMTENKLARKWHYLRYNICKQVLYYSMTDPKKHGYGLRYLFMSMFHKLTPIHKMQITLDNIQKEYDYDKSTLVADHDNAPDRGILPKNVYGTPKLVTFEDCSLYGVEQADTYLKFCYGDYMLPPKQMPPLNFRLIDLEKPYMTYLAERNTDVKDVGYR